MDLNSNKQWLDVDEVAEIIGYHPKTIKRYCSARRVDPKCGKKIGGRWKFRKEIILKDGLILLD